LDDVHFARVLKILFVQKLCVTLRQFEILKDLCCIVIHVILQCKRSHFVSVLGAEITNPCPTLLTLIILTL